MANQIKIGDIFESYESVKEKVQLFEKENHIKFYIRESRTLEATKGRIKKTFEKVNKDVIYYQIKYCCIHGGMTFKKKKKSIGERQTSTFKQGCKAHIYLKLSEDERGLKVIQMDSNHNHEVSHELYQHLLQQRKLSNGTKRKTKELLDLTANKKLVQQKISLETGKIVTLKDLSNKEFRRNLKFQTNNLSLIVNTLEAKYNATVRVAVDDLMNMRGLFIQDVNMKQCFNSYPEIIFADATYKLLDIKIPVYVMMVEDSNGQSEVVCVGLLFSEDEETLNWFLETFKNDNPAWNKTRIIMTDKDAKERSVFKKHFPSASLLICLFHTLRTFKREVNCSKLEIIPAQQILCREILQQMAYSKTEKEYNKLYKQLQKAATRPVKDYFDENWHSIKEEWTLGMQFNTGNFLNATYNHVDSFNAKLKSVITTYSSLELFVENLYVVLQSMQQERDHKAALMIQKVPTKTHSCDTPEGAYFQFLTPYAFKFVNKQLELIDKVNVVKKNDKFVSKGSNDLNLQVSEDTCECIFHVSVRLPCRHIFNVRKKLELELFSAALCDQRWSRDYYKKSQRIFQEDTLDENFDHSGDSLSTVSVLKPRRFLSTHEKFRRASHVANQLASIVSEACASKFERKMEFLEELVNAWGAGKEVGLNVCSYEDSQDVSQVVEIA